MNYLHKLYVLLGHIICKVLLFVCKVKDAVNPPKTETVLFVTHPDDDTLFFHTAIKEYKPYVALMVTGWSIKRLKDFIIVMKHYGVRFRAYDTEEDNKNAKLKIQKQIKEVLAIKDFARCLTHNSEGEYGHINHRLVHNCVVEQANMDILVPALKEKIKNFPLDEQNIKEKERIFNDFYTTETFVIEEYSVWLKNEKLVRLKNNG